MARRRKISSSGDRFPDGWTLSIPIASTIPKEGWLFTGVVAGIALPIYLGSLSLLPKNIPGTLGCINTPPSTVNSSARMTAHSRVNMQLRHGTSSDPIPVAKPAASRSASGFSIPKAAERFAPACGYLWANQSLRDQMATEILAREKWDWELPEPSVHHLSNHLDLNGVLTCLRQLSATGTLSSKGIATSAVK